MMNPHTFFRAVASAAVCFALFFVTVTSVDTTVTIGGVFEAGATSSMYNMVRLSDPTPTTTTTDTGTGPGGHAGSGEHLLLRMFWRLAEKHLGLEPGDLFRETYPMTSIVPPHTPLTVTKAEEGIICALQAAMRDEDDFSRALPLVAAAISSDLDLSYNGVYTALNSSSFCSSYTAARQAFTNVVKAEPVQKQPARITFAVDEDHIPVSTNLAFNACIRGSILRDGDGKPYTCQRYHSGNVWYHPDTHISFLWNRKRPEQLSLGKYVDIVVLNDSQQTELLAQSSYSVFESTKSATNLVQELPSIPSIQSSLLADTPWRNVN